MKINISKYIYNQNWNIGFASVSAEEFIHSQTVGKVQWMKHQYKDRFFADPFVLKITEDSLVLFAEELEFFAPKGRIVELVVDIKTKELKHRYVLLDTDTHLSYPAIWEEDGEVFVYPENGASGKLNLYRYDAFNHRLVEVRTLINEPLTDATIYRANNKYWLIATKAPNTQEKAFLFQSSKLMDNFEQLYPNEIVSDIKSSRPAGNLFEVNGKIYRPAQDCEERYGAAISIMRVEQFENDYREQLVFKLTPNSFRYNLGLHTINFKNSVCVIDGYGYLYPILGRVYNCFSQIKQQIKKAINAK